MLLLRRCNKFWFLAQEADFEAGWILSNYEKGKCGNVQFETISPRGNTLGF